MTRAEIELIRKMSLLNLVEYDLVITNGICVTASDVAPYDVAIKDEKIVLLAPSGSLAGATTKRIIDAEGGYVTVCNTILEVVR